MNRLLTSGLGLGLLPGAPGTWGSLLPAVVFMTAGILFGPAAAIWAMAVLLGAGCVVSVVCSPSVIAQTGRTDPGQIVSDEVAGQALALLLAQLIAPLDFCWMSAFLFGLFRFFDIVKKTGKTAGRLGHPCRLFGCRHLWRSRRNARYQIYPIFIWINILPFFSGKSFVAIAILPIRF